jgi:hypothetical protein
MSHNVLVPALALAACLIANGSEAAEAVRTKERAPPELYRAIRVLSGTWKISEEFPPSAMFPNGGTGQGTEIWRAGPGNITLVYEYHSTNPGGVMWATAVLWWDHEEKKLRELWCTSQSSKGCVVSTADIRWEGDDLVFTDSYESNGQRVFSRETWSQMKADTHNMTIAESPEIGNLRPWLISHAIRVK